MSFVEVNPVEPEAIVEVDYMGGTVEMNANHSWLAVQTSDGKSVLISFSDEPYVVNGVWGTKGEYTILAEVDYLKPEDALRTLRKVQGLNLEECIISNAEELSHKIAKIVSSDLDIEQKILELFDAKEGLFTEFHEYQDSLLVDKVNKQRKLAKERADNERLRVLAEAKKKADEALSAEIERQKPKQPVQACDPDACSGQCVEGSGQTDPKPRVRVFGVVSAIPL